ncbi:MAG: Omp28-related outer membrane protein [Bacteroidales bacterium]|nr:Omp28-related outer membrane protein [Bacteroidales bacterium]
MTQRLFFILTLAFSAICPSAMAADGELTIGYCNGEMASESRVELTGKGWVSAAIKLPSAALSAYQGNDISAIRAALVNRVNIDTLRVWVRTTLDGEDLASGFLTRNTDPAVAKEWNEVELSNPYTISSDNELYVGLSYHQKLNVQALSFVNTALGGTCWLQLGEDGEWTDCSDNGALGIEAVVTGAQLPDYDLGLLGAEVSPWPAGGATAVKVKLTLANYGLQDVSGFTVALEADPEVYVECHLEQTVASNSSITTTFVVDPGEYTDDETLWSVVLLSVDDGLDANTANNTAQATSVYLKNVFVEEFTTEECVNCPAMATRLHNALAADEQYEEQVAVVCHHAGYYTDTFTQPCDESLTWFYNAGGNTYAPAIMVDRSTRYSSSTTSPLFNTTSESDLTDAFDQALERRANVMVGLSCSFNSDSTQVDVTATCLRKADASLANPRLTVYLTEDDVEAVYQSGATGKYFHQHVIRGYNSIWGEEIPWEGEARSATLGCSFTIDPSWTFSKLKLVGVISNLNADDPTDCEVSNCVSVALTDSSIEKVPDSILTTLIDLSSSEGEEEWFDLHGRRVASPQAGNLYILRQGSTVTKVIY